MLRSIFRILLIVYSISVIVITQLPIILPFRMDFTQIRYNLMPFNFLVKSINIMNGLYLEGYEMSKYVLPAIDKIFKSFGYNLLLFIPLGFLLPIVCEKTISFKKIILIGFMSSILIEILQLIIMITTITPWRVFDVDDIIANTIGGIIGFGIYGIIMRLLNERRC